MDIVSLPFFSKYTIESKKGYSVNPIKLAN